MKQEPKKVLTEEDIFNQKDIDAVTDYINKEQQKQHLIDIMQKDEELGLYDEPNQALKDAAERYSEYLEDFENKNTYEHGFKDGAKWQQERSYSEEDLNKHVIEFLEWREEYFEMYHGNKNHGLYYARNKYNSLYYNEDRHTALTRKYYNLHELLELFNKFKNK